MLSTSRLQVDLPTDCQEGDGGVHRRGGPSQAGPSQAGGAGLQVLQGPWSADPDCATEGQLERGGDVSWAHSCLQGPGPKRGWSAVQLFPRPRQKACYRAHRQVVTYNLKSEETYIVTDFNVTNSDNQRRLKSWLIMTNSDNQKKLKSPNLILTKGDMQACHRAHRQVVNYNLKSEENHVLTDYNKQWQIVTIRGNSNLDWLWQTVTIRRNPNLQIWFWQTVTCRLCS